MKNSMLLPRLKSPPEQQQLLLWSDKKPQVIEQIALQNQILTASKVPHRLALGDERYYLSLHYQFPLQFYRDEVEAAIKASDEWRYPNVVELQALIECLCDGQKPVGDHQGVRG